MSVAIDDRTMTYAYGGLATPNAVTAEEAIRMAGLGWDVVKRRAAYENAQGSGWKVHTNAFAIVREDTDTPLGRVGSTYDPVQNTEAFDFANNLVDDGGLFSVAFEARGGSQVGLIMEFPETVLIGGEDPHQRYLMMRLKHDGTGAVLAALGESRMGCTNQFMAKIAGAKTRWSIRHTRTAKGQLDQAREALDLSLKGESAYAKAASGLMMRKLTEQEIRDTVDYVHEAMRYSDRQVEKSRDLVLANLRDSTTIPDAHRGTAWGLFNAITERFDWGFEYRTSESRLISMVEGRAAKGKQLAWDALTELAEVA